MQRRLFLHGSSAAALLTLSACGGGDSAGAEGGDDPTLELSARKPRQPQPPATDPTPVTVAYPFGSRKDLVNGRYPYGIAPASATASGMDASIQACYAAWKARNLVKSPSFTATTGVYAGQVVSDAYHVRFPNIAYACVSEGIGYGMLICVLMAGHDASARTYFNGLLRTARGRPAYGHMNYGRAEARYLHEWRLSSAMGSAGEGWNAADGDLDIALALLMADRQWGSAGAVNYRQEGLNTIAAMKAINFAATGEPRGPQRTNTRTSDHMIGHFRSFRAATGDAFWDLAISRCYTLITGIVAGFSPVARLQPGFIVDCATSPVPSPGNLVESPYEGIYDANAIRNPWRWGTDYLFSGDAGWKAIVSDMTAFLKADCAGNPFNTAGLYSLAGAAVGPRYFAESTVGPLMVGCMVDAAHQGFLDTLWTANASHFTTDYYDSELQLLPMIVASGNWWRP